MPYTTRIQLPDPVAAPLLAREPAPPAPCGLEPRSTPAHGVTDALEVRVAVEAFCVEKLLVDGVPVAGILEELLDDQRAFAAAGAVGRFVDSDREFHSAIVGAAGNPVLSELCDEMGHRLRELDLEAARDTSARVEQVLEEHSRIVSAIGRADVAEARDATLNHLYGTLAALNGGRT